MPDTSLKQGLNGKYFVKDNTFFDVAKTDPMDFIEIEVGDSKQQDFKPQFKVKRWDNEVNFSIRAEEHSLALVEFDGEKIKYITPDYEVHQYDKPEASDDGGFEFEWVLTKKPNTNVLIATIQTKGLDFFYQGELTQNEIADGISRPENVIDSYAVYHSTKGRINRDDGMEYKTGKFCHIYRVDAIDSEGKKTWCKMDIDVETGTLKVTVPEKFLETAVYPVTVDPTFGYTSAGATGIGVSAAISLGMYTVPTDFSSFTKLSLYHKMGTFDTTMNVKGIVVNSIKNIVTNGVGDVVLLPATGATPTLADLTFATPPTLTAGLLFGIGLIGQNSNREVLSDSVTVPICVRDNSNNYTTPTNPTDDSIQYYQISVYATYSSLSSATGAITGTATSSITESDIVTGGKTIIATLTGDTFVPDTGIVYVGGMTGGFAGTTSAQTIDFNLTGGTDITAKEGDLVIVSYTVGSTADRSLAIRNTGGTNYTLIDSELYQDDTFDSNLRVGYRFMPSTPEFQVLLTETVGGGTGSTADAGRYTIHVFRYVDSSTPLDVAAVSAGGINTRIADPASITPTTTGAIIYVVGAGAGGTGGTYTAGYLSGFVAGSTADTNDAFIGAGYVAWTSGAYNPAAFGGGGTDTTNDAWTSMSVALRPAVRFNAERQNIINGLDSAQSEGTGWDAVVKATQSVGGVVRTSDTVVTITLDAQASYDITATETITVTLPATSVIRGQAIVATPTFTVATGGGGGGSATPTLMLMGCGV